jgi:hypothetical protein
MPKILPGAAKPNNPKLLDQVRQPRQRSVVRGQSAESYGQRSEVRDRRFTDDTHHGGQARVVPPFSRFQVVKSAACPPWRVVGG